MKMTIPTKMQLWYPKQVVDARAGPGMKSMTKFKSKIKKAMENNIVEKIKKKKHRYEREYSPTLSDKSDDADMAEVDFLEEDVGSGGSSRTNSPGGSDCEDNNSQEGKSRRLKAQAKKRDSLPDISDFIDFNYWTREVICCGSIYRGRCGEILCDPRFLRPCKANLKNTQHKIMLKNIQHKTEKIDNQVSPISLVTPSKSFNDNSSDSGYDESSNPGVHPDHQGSGSKSTQVSIEQSNRPIANYD